MLAVDMAGPWLQAAHIQLVPTTFMGDDFGRDPCSDECGA